MNNRNWFALIAIMVFMFSTLTVAHAAEWFYSGTCTNEYYEKPKYLGEMKLWIIGNPTDKSFSAEAEFDFGNRKDSGNYGSISGQIKLKFFDGYWVKNQQAFVLTYNAGISDVCIIRGTTPPPGFEQPNGASTEKNGFVGTWVNNENGGRTVVINADGTGSMTFHTGTQFRKADSPYPFKWLTQEYYIIYSFIQDPYKGLLPGPKYFYLGTNGTMTDNASTPATYYKK